jgi:hypothetical protein
VCDENTLRKKAADAIQAGKMPAQRAVRAWAGPGSGARCSLCGLPVRPDEVEFELEFGDQWGASGSRTVDAHCFAAWEFERRKFDRLR